MGVAVLAAARAGRTHNLIHRPLSPFLRGAGGCLRDEAAAQPDGDCNQQQEGASRRHGSAAALAHHDSVVLMC